MDNLQVRDMLVGPLRRLSTVFRYSSIPVQRFENVAEHTFYACFYCYMIAADLSKRFPELIIDKGRMLEEALIHDLDESMTGDFLRVVKYGHPGLKEALDGASNSLMQELSDKVGIDLRSVWQRAKGDDIEGFILCIADFLTVVAYIYEEYMSGNRHLLAIFREIRKYIKDLYNDASDDYKDYFSPYLIQSIEVLTQAIDEQETTHATS